jgi:hypothetical protein
MRLRSLATCGCATRVRARAGCPRGGSTRHLCDCRPTEAQPSRAGRDLVRKEIKTERTGNSLLHRVSRSEREIVVDTPHSSRVFFPHTSHVVPSRSRPPLPHRLRARDHTRARVRWLPRDGGGRWVAAFGNRIQCFRGASIVERGAVDSVVCGAAADDVALAERERVGASAPRGEPRRADEAV